MHLPLRFLLFLACLTSAVAPRPQRPNVVLIFMDDMGYGDLSCYGATQYHTPNIDQLAAEGMRFTNFLTAQAVCTASRAALLTGCYPNRIGLYGALYPQASTGLNPEETTLPELLKNAGYTTAVFGKWHLGDNPVFMPLRQGFDEYVGLPYSNDMWPVDYNGKPVTDSTDWRRTSFQPLFLIEGDRPTRPIRTLDDQAALTGIYTERAVSFIRKKRNSPFFLYMPHSMPHVPIAASARFKGKSQQGLYGDMMMELDWSVGEVMRALKETGQDKNTIVIVTSDNGPWLNFGNNAGSSGGFREGKGVTFEGGHRVPCLVRWPGVIPAGRVCNKLATTLDWLPTLAMACRAATPTRPYDGVDITPLLRGDLSASPRRHFYYYYRKNSLEAVRRDDWKLVLPHTGRSYEGVLPGKDGYPAKVPENRPYPQALYDLRRDPGERYDVQAMYPEIIAELQELAEKARADLGDDITGRIGQNVRPPGLLTKQ